MFLNPDVVSPGWLYAIQVELLNAYTWSSLEAFALADKSWILTGSAAALATASAGKFACGIKL